MPAMISTLSSPSFTDAGKVRLGALSPSPSTGRRGQKSGRCRHSLARPMLARSGKLSPSLGTADAGKVRLALSPSLGTADAGKVRLGALSPSLGTADAGKVRCQVVAVPARPTLARRLGVCRRPCTLTRRRLSALSPSLARADGWQGAFVAVAVPGHPADAGKVRLGALSPSLGTADAGKAVWRCLSPSLGTADAYVRSPAVPVLPLMLVKCGPGS